MLNKKYKFVMSSNTRNKSERRNKSQQRRNKTRKKSQQRMKKSRMKNDGTKEEDCDKKIKELSVLGTSSERRTILMKLAQHTNNVECIKHHISQFTRERLCELNEYVNKKDQFGYNALNLASIKDNLATDKKNNLAVVKYLSEITYDPIYLITAIESNNEDIDFYKEIINNEKIMYIIEKTLEHFIKKEAEITEKEAEIISILKEKIKKQLEKDLERLLKQMNSCKEINCIKPIQKIINLITNKLYLYKLKNDF